MREELARSQAELLKLANFDALTALPNRRHFHEIFGDELQRARARDTRLGLLLVGVNRFRQINDSLGPRAGDQLLLEISRRLIEALRRDEATSRPRVVARVGGDEFALLLPDLKSEAELDRVAARALDVFQQPFPVDGQELFITTSIGAVVFPADGDEVDALLGRSDLAMRRHWALVCCAFAFCWYNLSQQSPALAPVPVEDHSGPVPEVPPAAPSREAGRGENQQHRGAPAAPAVVAGGAAGRARVAGAGAHAVALLARVVGAAPTTPAARLA